MVISVEMTYLQTEDMIEEGADGFRDAPGLEKKALAAEELLGRAQWLGVHTARFARTAWRIDMLFFCLALLVFYGVIFFGSLENILPPAVSRLLRPVHNAETLTREAMVWLYCVIGLTVIPLISDAILAIECKHTKVTVWNIAAGARSETSNAIQRIKNALYGAHEELTPTSYLPPWTVYVAGALYLLPMTARVFAFGGAREPSTIGKLMLTVLICGGLLLLVFGSFVLILWLKLFVLSLLFSSGRSKRELNDLIEDLPDYEEEFIIIRERREAEEAEQKRLADLKEGAELYRKATAESTVNKVLLARAAEKGDPQANLEMGKNIVENVDGLNRREVAALYEDAKKHFRVADAAGLPDGILMYASARLMTEAHDAMGWLNILRRLRTVERIQISMTLRSVYTKVRDQLIDRIKLAMAHAGRDE